MVRINERIRINSEPIGDDDFALVHDLVDHTADRLVSEGDLPWHPSFFETLTAIAFEHFSRRKVDIAVLEVGMGGRLDATNVIVPLISVITDISLDHQKFLGNTVAEIAAEKAAALGAAVPFNAAQSEAAPESSAQTADSTKKLKDKDLAQYGFRIEDNTFCRESFRKHIIACQRL